jgi:PAS domain S-box-containing protein
MQNDSGRQYEAMSVNLHYRGAEITTDAKASRGTSVCMRLAQDVTGRSPSAASGEVRWVSNTQGRYRYGISFNEDFRWVFTLSKETLSVFKPGHNASVAEFVLNSITDGVFSVNRKWQIISFNHAAEKITGWKRDEVIGRNCQEVFNAGSCNESIKQGISIVNRSLFITTALGKRILVKTKTTPLVGTDGEIIGGVQVFRHVSSVRGRRVILDSVVPLAHGQAPTVNIQTFGGFCLKMNGQSLYDRLWKGRRSKELLKAIIALGGVKVSMEKLSSLLWPDSDGDHALNNLKMALSRLRRIGGDEYSVPSNWLAVKHHRVSLVRSVCRVDALEFGRKLERISDLENRQSLQHVLTLYTNDFLPQDETPWITPFRDHLRTLFIKGVLHFATLKNIEDEVVLVFLEQARHSDPLHEGVYACLMTHYIKAGFPATALDVFHKAEKIIYLRTGISPGAVLQSLARQAKK